MSLSEQLKEYLHIRALAARDPARKEMFEYGLKIMEIIDAQETYFRELKNKN
jgi:hypothetical protein